MFIKSLSLSAKTRLREFCKLTGVKYSFEFIEEPGIELYDFWIDDEKLNLGVKPKEVYFYTHDYDCRIYRDEFQEIQII